MTSEKFQGCELEGLREDLMRGTPDPLQVAELFQVFLASNGYGVSLSMALEAACRVGRSGCSPTSLHEELESLALVM
jgi:hypothetical protein